MSDPLYPSSLNASTAMTMASDVEIDEAGREAARLVEALATTKQKPSRKAKAFRARLDAANSVDHQLVPPVALNAAAHVERIDPPALVGAGSAPALVSSFVQRVETPAASVVPAAGSTVDEEAGSSVDAIPQAEDGVPEVQPHVLVVLPPPAEPRPAEIAVHREQMIDLGNKVADTIRGNIDASVEFWISMLMVKTPSDAFELNAANVRRQVTTFVGMYHDLAALTAAVAVASLGAMVPSRP